MRVNGEMEAEKINHNYYYFIIIIIILQFKIPGLFFQLLNFRQISDSTNYFLLFSYLKCEENGSSSKIVENSCLLLSFNAAVMKVIETGRIY